MAEEDVQTTLTTLTSQLDTLEESLKPLLASNYQDLVSAQQSPLIKAKLNVLLSYAVHDLIWVYLKTAGVDPATHPVMPEIERLKTYFAKLKSAETGQPIPSATPITTQRRMQIDKQAASRFITHAINSQKSKIDPDYQAPEGAEGGEEFEMEGGKHTRFDLAEEENEEVERLLDDELEESDDEVEVQEVVKKGKGKEKETKKGGRKILDPFAGYDQPKPSPSTASKPKSAPSSAEKRKRSEVEDSPATPSAAAAGDASASTSQKKKKKKDGKKLKIKK